MTSNLHVYLLVIWIFSHWHRFSFLFIGFSVLRHFEIVNSFVATFYFPQFLTWESLLLISDAIKIELIRSALIFLLIRFPFCVTMTIDWSAQSENVGFHFVTFFSHLFRKFETKCLIEYFGCASKISASDCFYFIHLRSNGLAKPFQQQTTTIVSFESVRASFEFFEMRRKKNVEKTESNYRMEEMFWDSTNDFGWTSKAQANRTNNRFL